MSRAPAAQLDDLDRWLLDELQSTFPIERRPWDAIASRRGGLSGDQVLERVKALKDAGLIRQISPIFDTRALGYTSTLVAARVDESRLDEAAAVVSAHRGVSHNYRREAEFNLWFTLAVPPGADLGAELDELARAAGLDAARPLPTEKTFHIGVKLDMSGPRKPRRPSMDDDEPTTHTAAPVALCDFDKRAIRVTQDDLPPADQPFDAACEALGVQFDELKQWFEKMKRTGALRRFAAILRHRSAGFTANGMVTWIIPPQHIDAAGRIAARFDAVSHCYQRPAYDDWPYNLYTMVHARTTESCEQTVDRIADALAPLGVTRRRILYSTHEYKKARVRYFES